MATVLEAGSVERLRRFHLRGRGLFARREQIRTPVDSFHDMATPLPCRLAILVALVIGLAVAPAAGQPRPLDVLAHAARAPRALGAPPILEVTFNNTAQAAGTTLVAGVSVGNPGSGPLADFYFLIVLPDGTTVVSTGPGLGARFGTLANLRTLVPVARGISLAPAFPFQSANFFSYTFTGAEPQGVYLVYFVALTAGALNDGAIGAGELVALASRTFTVGPTGAPQVDTGRSVGATIGAAGGSVQTSTAAGVGLRLTVPAGSVQAATPITIAPLTAFNDLAIGPLVAGVRAEPSGLRFTTPATLSVTLPAGFQVPAFGLKGFVADSDGQNLQIVPVSIVGNVATLRVPHFSVAGVAVNSNLVDLLCSSGNSNSPQQRAACTFLVPLYDEEQRRLEAQGGPVSARFRAAWLLLMEGWVIDGILPRLTAARFPPGDPAADMLEVGREWLSFHTIYTDFETLVDRSNESAGQPLGALIDRVQNQLVRDLPLTIAAVNQACLADKTRVVDRVRDVSRLVDVWEFMLLGPPPFAVAYCLDVDIQAAPVPVLSPGTPVTMPLDIRMRFIDGSELPGISLSVAITASNGTVSPAGGVLTTPIVTNIAVTPTSAVGTVTISAAVNAGALSLFLPVRTLTVAAGADLMFTDARLTASLNIRHTLANVAPIDDVGGATPGFGAASVNAANLATRRFPDPPVGSGAGFQAGGSANVSRTVARPPGALVVGYTGSATASILTVGEFFQSESATVRTFANDRYTVALPVAFNLVVPACIGRVQVSDLGSNLFLTLIPGAPVRVPAGTYSVTYEAGGFLSKNLRTGVTEGESPVALACSLEYRAAP